MSSNLVMHCDPTRKTGLTIEQLRGYATPPASLNDKGRISHVPIAHASMRDMVVERLEAVGLGVKSEQIAVSTRKDVVIDGEEVEAYSKAFGVFDVEGLDYAIDDTATMGLSVGWRNSSNKQLPAAVVVGSRVFVCDNLCFSGTLTLKRRHTKNIMDDLPDMIAAAFGRVEELANRQYAIYERLRDIEVSEDVAAAVIVRACQASGKGPLASKNVLPILEYYNREATDEESEAGLKFNRDLHGHGTAYALWNAFTGFAGQYVDRNMVETTDPLLAVHNVITSRFAPDIARDRKQVISITAQSVRDSEPTVAPIDEVEEDSFDAYEVEDVEAAPAPAPAPVVNALYDPSDEDEIVGGYDDEEWEEV